MRSRRSLQNRYSVAALPEVNANMTRRVILRPQVPDDLQEILLYLEQHSIEVADRFISSAWATLEYLAQMPGMGSPKDFRSTVLKGIRSWAVRGFANYLVFYQTTADAIVILAIVHGARNVRALLKARADSRRQG